MFACRLGLIIEREYEAVGVVSMKEFWSLIQREVNHRLVWPAEHLALHFKNFKRTITS